MSGLAFTEDRADAPRIAAHLTACDSAFVPRLGDRVEIADYAKKIVAKARRFEAWQGGELAGLVAVYCNAPGGQAAFVTSVSVLPRMQGKGIGVRLMERCIAAMRAAGLGGIDLEVGRDNRAAITLYRKLGFAVTAHREDTEIMTLALDGTNR